MQSRAKGIADHILRKRNSMRDFVRPSVRWSVDTSRKMGKLVFFIVFVYGCRMWMGVGRPCAPVRNDIVNPRHLPSLSQLKSNDSIVQIRVGNLARIFLSHICHITVSSQSDCSNRFPSMQFENFWQKDLLDIAENGFAKRFNHLKFQTNRYSNKLKVAIIGSGPAGYLTIWKAWKTLKQGWIIDHHASRPVACGWAGTIMLRKQIKSDTYSIFRAICIYIYCIYCTKSI